MKALLEEWIPRLAAVDWGEAFPVVVSLVVIEALLSVDNALAMAAMAAHLPDRQRYVALRFGMLGAYVFRGLALACASYILEHFWVKILGALYLLHLAADHFAEQAEREEAGGGEGAKLQGRGFWATVLAIELMDLSLSVDNVVAAVAMSPHLWVVCTGVFIGILALRFVAGYCIKLIERFPVLESAAFVLIGYVGGILVFELCTHRVVTSLQKFLGVVLILAVSIIYGRNPGLRRVMAPAMGAGRKLSVGYAALTRPVSAGLFWVFHGVFVRPWRRVWAFLSETSRG